MQEKSRQNILKRDMFLNPQTKGKWLDLHFKTSPPKMPAYAIDHTGEKFTSPEKVKEIYLREGTLFLKEKINAPGPDEGKEHPRYQEPPDLEKRAPEDHNPTRKNRSTPKWWKTMYNRKAKNIPDSVWEGLMKEPSIEEILKTIKGIPNDKAAGYDGIDINIIKLLAEDETSPLTRLLQYFFKVAFTQGMTLPSWRKAVITMIPKKREDGSWTDKVRDMRPISVLQEFGKIASKIC
jgi:hypothetical protein